MNEEELDKELLWNLQLLSEVWMPGVCKTETNMTSKVRMKSVLKYMFSFYPGNPCGRRETAAIPCTVGADHAADPAAALQAGLQSGLQPAISCPPLHGSHLSHRLLQRAWWL